MTFASDENVRTKRPGGDDEDDRQRDLNDDQEIAETEAFANDATPLLFQRFVWLYAGTLADDRATPKEDGGRDWQRAR